MNQSPQWDRYQMVSDISKSPVSANLAIEAPDSHHPMQPDLGLPGSNRVISLMDRARNAYAWAGSVYSTRLCTARVSGAIATLGLVYIASKTASEISHGVALADVHHSTSLLGVEVNGHAVHDPNAHQHAAHAAIKHAAGSRSHQGHTSTIGAEVNGKAVKPEHDVHHALGHTVTHQEAGPSAHNSHTVTGGSFKLGVEVNGHDVHGFGHHAALMHHQQTVHAGTAQHNLVHDPHHSHHNAHKQHHADINEADSKKSKLKKRIQEVTLKSGDNPWTIAARALKQAHEHVTKAKIWNLDLKTMRINHLNLNSSRLLSIGQKLKVPLG